MINPDTRRYLVHENCRCTPRVERHTSRPQVRLLLCRVRVLVRASSAPGSVIGRGFLLRAGLQIDRSAFRCTVASLWRLIGRLVLGDGAVVSCARRCALQDQPIKKKAVYTFSLDERYPAFVNETSTEKGTEKEASDRAS